MDSPTAELQRVGCKKIHKLSSRYGNGKRRRRVSRRASVGKENSPGVSSAKRQCSLGSVLTPFGAQVQGPSLLPHSALEASKEPGRCVVTPPTSLLPTTPASQLNVSFGAEFDAQMAGMMVQLEDQGAHGQLFSQTVSTKDKSERSFRSKDEVVQKLFAPCEESTEDLERHRSSVGHAPARSTNARRSVPDDAHHMNRLQAGLQALVSPEVPQTSTEREILNETALSSCPQLAGKQDINSSETNSTWTLSQSTHLDSNPLSLKSWGIPEVVVSCYEASGIFCLFPWQAECLLQGQVLQGQNLIYSAPTSGGKSIVAELLLLKRVLETRRKAIMILPFVSVTREKAAHLQRVMSGVGVRVAAFVGSETPRGGFSCIDVAVCTIERANSLVNRLLEEKRIGELTMLVVDEMHMLGDSHRGYLLELMLTKVQYVCASSSTVKSPNSSRSAVQIVGMSATLPNLSTIASWLCAELYTTDFRPVPLTQYLKAGKIIYDGGLRVVRKLEDGNRLAGDEDDVLFLCAETLSEGHSVLLFCPTKAWCEKLAVNLTELGQRHSVFQVDTEKLRDVAKQLQCTSVGLDHILAKTLPCGVAFHHAGLTMEERDILEQAFRQGYLRVLVATSTLASGVNLPARRVIIRTAQFYGSLLAQQAYQQMSGRAGRQGLDSYGESYLLCKPAEKRRVHALLSAPLEPVRSCLVGLQSSEEGKGAGMQRALLEVLVSGVAQTHCDVLNYAMATLLAAEQKEEMAVKPSSRSSRRCSIDTTVTKAVKNALKFLVDNEFVSARDGVDEEPGASGGKSSLSDRRYCPTQLGEATLASALSPCEALEVFAELQRAQRCFVLENELHIVYQVTLIFLQAQWPNLDWYRFLRYWEKLSPGMRQVADLVGVQESFLVQAVHSGGTRAARSPQQKRQLMVHRRFYTALILQELVQEVPLNEVAHHYGASRGLLQSLQQASATFAGMVTVFCAALGWHNLELLLDQFQSRLSFGVERQLCDLVQLSIVGGTTARHLYNAGYRNLASLVAALPEEIEAVLRQASPFKSSHQDEEVGGAAGPSKHARRKQLRRFHNMDLTDAEAAHIIVQEAGELLQRNAIEHSTGGMNRQKGHQEVSEQNKVKSSAQQDSFPVVQTGQLQEQAADIENRVTTNNNSTETVEGKQLVGRKSSVDDEIKGVVGNKESLVNAVSSESPIHHLSPADAAHGERRADPVHKCVNVVSVETSEPVASSLLVENSPQLNENILHANMVKTEVDRQSSPADSWLADSAAVDDMELLLQAMEASVQNNSSGISPAALCGFVPASRLVRRLSVSGKDSIAESEAVPEEVTDDGYINPSSCTQSFNQGSVTSNCVNTVAVSLTTFNKRAFATEHASQVRCSTPSQWTSVHGSLRGAEMALPHDCVDNFSDHCVAGSSLLEFEELLPASAVDDRVEHDSSSVADDRVEHNLSQDLFADESLCHSSLIGLSREDSEGFVVPDPPQKPLTTSTPLTDPAASACSPQLFQESSAEDVLDVLELSQSLMASGDKAHSLIDVCGHCQLFRTFLSEWQSQPKFALALATEADHACITAPGQEKEAPIVGLPITGSQQTLCGVCISWSQNEVYYVSLRPDRYSPMHLKDDDKEAAPAATLSQQYRLQAIVDILTGHNNAVVAFDMKEVCYQFYRATGVLLMCQSQDPKVAAWLLSPDDKEKTLEQLIAEQVPEYCRRGTDALYFLVSAPERPPRLCAAAKAILSMQLMEKLSQLLSEENLLQAFTQTEMPAMLCFAHMELCGLGADRAECDKQQQVLRQRLEELEEQAYSLVGHSFALTSPQDVAQVLFIELRLPTDPTQPVAGRGRGRGRGRGQGRGRGRLQRLSTSKEVLQKLTALHPLATILLEWRRINSALSKVIFPLQEEMHNYDKRGAYRVHSRVAMHTATGRISLTEPNLQNVPKEFSIACVDMDGYPSSLVCAASQSSTVCMRNIFVPCHGRLLLAADYSQLELRLLAHLSGDQKLCTILHEQQTDVFRNMAGQWLYTKPCDITDSQRQQAKQICYGMLYGISAKGLAEQLDLPVDEASRFMDSFKASYSGVTTYMQHLVERCRQVGYVTTIGSRKRFLPAIGSSTAAARFQAERQAVNTTIQGSAADLVKVAMINIDNKLSSCSSHHGNAQCCSCSSSSGSTVLDSRAFLVLQLHDELMYEVCECFMSEMAQLVQSEMESALNLSVPMPVKLKMGRRWGQLQPYPN